MKISFYSLTTNQICLRKSQNLMDAPPIALKSASLHLVFIYLETLYFVYVIVNSDFLQFRLAPWSFSLALFFKEYTGGEVLCILEMVKISSLHEVNISLRICI